MVSTDIPRMGFDNISMDVLGPLRKTAKQHEYILTIQDLLTKYSLAILLKTITSIDIADAFICRFGSPRAIVTDQGSNFISSLMKKIVKRFMIQQYMTTAYRPQSNGSIERSHHVTMEYLKMCIDKHSNRDDWIDLAMFSSNTAVHEGTKFSLDKFFSVV